MDQKILSEIKKLEKKNKQNQLPVSVFFTDRKKIYDLENTIKSLPKNSAIIIREYDLEQKDREIFARKIKDLTNSRNIRIIVGKDLVLAIKIKADGLHFSDLDHLPLQFLERKKFKKKFIFSFACHSFKSVLKAQKLKADMIFISPIFPTKSHLNTQALGIKNLAKISFKTKSSSYVSPSLYALGGINSQNLLSVRKLGISGFAAISLFLNNL